MCQELFVYGFQVIVVLNLQFWRHVFGFHASQDSSHLISVRFIFDIHPISIVEGFFDEAIFQGFEFFDEHGEAGERRGAIARADMVRKFSREAVGQLVLQRLQALDAGRGGAAAAADAADGGDGADVRRRRRQRSKEELRRVRRLKREM